MNKRELLARTFERTGLGRLLLRTTARWRGLVVFNYHRVGDPAASAFDHALWSATQDEFDRQVGFLNVNFDVLRVADLDDVARGRSRRAVMITFDDGYRDNYELAFPVLRRHQTPATFFITSGFLDNQPIAWWDEIAWMVHSSTRQELSTSQWNGHPADLSTPAARERTIRRLLRTYKWLPASETGPFLDRLADATGCGRCPASVSESLWMTWDMVREMDRAGMDVGGHTVSHPVLANAGLNRQREEIFDSKRRIETELRHPISVFSYPVGQRDSFTDQTKALLAEAGYRWAFSFCGGSCPMRKADAFDLPRVAVSPNISSELFRATACLPWLFA